MLACSAFASDWPASAFSFIGVPEKIKEGTYQTIDGKMQGIVIRIVEVKTGSYDRPDIGFDFEAASKPPLEIGQTYLFEAVYDRHGIRYTKWKKVGKTPNQALQHNDPSCHAPCMRTCRASRGRG
jgi:hypothetical protein